MKKYNKLVRDKIPEIIEKNDGKPKIKILRENEYKKELRKKLLEETKEYIEDDNIEEIADILEVINAILENEDVSFEEIEVIRKNKKNERGAFKEKIFLESVEEE